MHKRKYLHKHCLIVFIVHEVVQPVIEKETIAPTVVHTTVPVHESHHAAPEHHGTSVLPVKTVAEFKASGQSLTGSTGVVNQDHYEGCPRPYNKDMQLGTTEADVNPHMHTSPIGSTHTHGATNAGPHNSNMMNKADPRVDSDLDGRGIGAGATGLGAGATGAGMTGNRSPNTPTGPQSPGMGNKLDPRVDSNRDGRGLQHTTSTASSASSMSDTNPHKKPSLLDRLNPMKDADHDGKKGFLR